MAASQMCWLSRQRAECMALPAGPHWQYRATMSSPAPHTLADDTPRCDPWTEDSLGFSNFSMRMAEALVGQFAPNGYVVGLHGEWGSGKSTVLNFVRRHLEKWKEEGRPDMVNVEWFDFEPWIVSGHQDLASAFFKVLSEKLGDAADKRSWYKRNAAAAIDLGAPPLIDAVSNLGIILDHTGGAASKAGAKFTKGAIKKAADRWLSEPSLQKSYDALVKRLRKADRRFVVFVDDIDRLTSDEIRAVMQMVKTVGRLPNVTYCLAYDRDIVWSALREMAPGDGARSGYAEKIVQHELEVPVASRSGLMRMLEGSLPTLPPPPRRGIRWAEMLQGGVQRWVRHPRDVIRIGNAMHFAWAALKDEVDAYDILCMEGLRLFDRKVFTWVRDNRALLLGEGMSYPQGEKEAENAAEQLSRTLSEDARADIVPILRLLFPNKSNIFGGRRGFTTERWSDVVARRGIATPAGFSAYFGMARSPASVPKTVVDEAAGPGVATERHVQLIDAMIALHDELGNSLVGQYLQEVNHRIDKFAADDLKSLLRALVDRADEIFTVDGDSGLFGPASSHRLLIGSIMEQLGPEQSFAVLHDIFTSSDSVVGLSAMYVDLGRALGAIPTEGAFAREYIEPERLEELAALLLPKILAADQADTLTELPHYYEVARAWSHIAGVDAPRAWLAREALRDAHTLAKISRGLLGSSYDGGETHYSLYSAPETDLYDLDALRTACKRFADASHLSQADKARVDALREGLAILARQDEARRRREEDRE